MPMLLFVLHELWSIIDDSGSVVSSVVSSHPALLSFLMLAGNVDRAPVLMRTGYRAQFLRQRKGHKKVRDRQEEHTLLFQPTRGRFILALGTMPVLTGMIAVCECSALCALVELSAKGLRTALFNGLHSGQMAGEQSVGEFGAIGQAIA